MKKLYQVTFLLDKSNLWFEKQLKNYNFKLNKMEQRENKFNLTYNKYKIYDEYNYGEKRQNSIDENPQSNKY